MRDYDLEYMGETGKQHGILIESRPSVPCAQRDYITYDIQNHDGDYHVDLGTVSDITITVSFCFNRPPDVWAKTARSARRWFMRRNGMKTLKFSDDIGFYYLVKKATMKETEREAIRYGRFEVEFTCYGYQYVTGGEKPIEGGTIYNPYDISHPIYKILGEGICDLNVNGKTATVNVGQNITIDTERKIAYREDGNMMNTSMAGDYEELYLKEEENKVTITQGFKISIIPMWRSL